MAPSQQCRHHPSHALYGHGHGHETWRAAGGAVLVQHTYGSQALHQAQQHIEAGMRLRGTRGKGTRVTVRKWYEKGRERVGVTVPQVREVSVSNTTGTS